MMIQGGLELRFRQWRAIFRACLQETMAYAAQAVIWFLTDIVGNILMLMVFLSVGHGKVIQGFAASDFALYFIGMVGISTFVTSHMQWEIGLEIKDGQLSTFLMRPVSWYQFMLLRNLAWRFLRLAMFIPGLLIFSFAFWPVLSQSRPHLDWAFCLTLILGHLVSITSVLAMSMLALFLEEATSLFETYYLPMLFLSGQIFPIALLPGWAQTLAKVLPFYYTTGLPAEVLSGRVSNNSIGWGVLGQLGWIVLCYFLFRLGWAKGMKRYTGTGM